ncbi:MAG: hypothetical protein JHC33_00965 [Ignisphaera sp.]|nr:hypothetical protein [Ignisphaera sp.]
MSVSRPDANRRRIVEAGIRDLSPSAREILRELTTASNSVDSRSFLRIEKRKKS